MKLSLKAKITLWFVVIIVVSLILYGSLILTVLRYNLIGEKYMQTLKDNPEISQTIIDR
ncbi:unnamed protein product, partial [marine sediment metagenome]